MDATIKNQALNVNLEALYSNEDPFTTDLPFK
jgi:hypothetical protein